MVVMKKKFLIIIVLFTFGISGCKNQSDIAKIDTKNLCDYYVEQMNEDGAYLMYGSKNKKAIAFVSSKIRIKNSNLDINNNVLSVYYYTTDKSVSSKTLYKYTYLISDSVHVDDIKVYLNDTESYFVNTIVSDKELVINH